MTNLKDDVLANLACSYNVAQFVSFSDGDPTIRHHAVRDSSRLDGALEDVLAYLIQVSTSGSINIRSFSAARASGNPFHYGISNADDAAALIRELARSGLYTIANETIDINDGGVSGVAAGGIVEFAPGDTPRAVEKPGIARLPIEIGFDVLQAIYGFDIDFGDLLNTRLEFSLHPRRCGTRGEHAIVWEVSDYAAGQFGSEIVWPNRFSRFIGDKAFGLILADALGHNVPFTTVVSRNVAPFSFGRRTGTGEWWMRTAPKEPVPGMYTTTYGWTDPFRVLNDEDSEQHIVASVLAQEGVNGAYSGATKAANNSKIDIVEGVAGRGDDFMLGKDIPEPLPQEIIEDVRKVTADLRKQLGVVRIEWVHDGAKVWILQMHRAKAVAGATTVLRAGTDPATWVMYNTSDGLEALRGVLAKAEEEHQGVEIVGDFGITSHVGELLSNSLVPIRQRSPIPDRSVAPDDGSQLSEST
ncbi:hypothetical protein [Mycolicibacterium tusciae]|uniref:hypothetical protein n=1 Tax=Mycolicibacterium tusciae TaxID=75922 RepID=UPI00024A12EF|nr:hypothetical protein [Mycolicibacterium tusciae]